MIMRFGIWVKLVEWNMSLEVNFEFMWYCKTIGVFIETYKTVLLLMLVVHCVGLELGLKPVFEKDVRRDTLYCYHSQRGFGFKIRPQSQWQS